MARNAETDADALLTELSAAAEALEDAERAIEEAGETQVHRVADAYDRFEDLMARYEEAAAGTGRETFQSYVEFQGELADFEESLDDDLPEREAFEEACELLDRRRLETSDFDRARKALSPVTDLTDLLDRRDRAEERYRQAYDAVEARIHELSDELDDVEEVLAFADADFDAPIEDLRDPIETYNERVVEAFTDFRRNSPARDVLGFVSATSAYPLVDYRSPPPELQEYLDDYEVGTETIPTLLEYAEYSRSKLSHYVDDPATFRGTVATNQTYLRRLDAEPLRIEWPPPSADELRWRIRELIPVVDRIAPEDALERLRTVREWTRDSEFERLRETARARVELSESERERLRSGEIEREAERLREERARLEDALSEYPEP